MKNNRQVLLTVIKVLGILSLLSICVIFFLRDAHKIETYRSSTRIITEDFQTVNVRWEVEYERPFLEKNYDSFKHKIDMGWFMEKSINNPFYTFTFEELYQYKDVLEIYVNGLESEEDNIRKVTFVESSFVVDVVWGFEKLNERELNQLIERHYNTLEDNLNADLIAIYAAFPTLNREEHIKILEDKYEGLLTFNNISVLMEWEYEEIEVTEEVTFTWEKDSITGAFKKQLESGIYKAPSSK